MKRKALVWSLLLALCLTAAGQTMAQSPTTAISVEHAWARATPAGAKTGAVYLTMVNRTTVADRLTSVSTPAAASAQVHQETESNGVMRMRELTSVAVESGGIVTLKPGGMHIMLVGLQHPLKEGQDFPLTLEFEKAGKVDLRVPIMKVGAMGDHRGM